MAAVEWLHALEAAVEFERPHPLDADKAQSDCRQRSIAGPDYANECVPSEVSCTGATVRQLEGTRCKQRARATGVPPLDEFLTDQPAQCL